MSFFTSSEFDSPLEKGSGARMKKSTLAKLEKGRAIYGNKITVNSGFRVQADFNRLKAKGYQVSRTSSHFKGYAADIRDTRGMVTKDAKVNLQRFLSLCEAMWQAGFRRFGIMNGVVHVDDDPAKKSPALWSYKTTNNEIWAELEKWFNSKTKPG